MVDLLFIDDSNLSGTKRATHRLGYLAANGAACGLYGKSPFSAPFPFLTSRLRELVSLDLAVHNKDCPVLGHIFLMPAEIQT